MDFAIKSLALLRRDATRPGFLFMALGTGRGALARACVAFERGRLDPSGSWHPHHSGPTAIFCSATWLLCAEESQSDWIICVTRLPICRGRQPGLAADGDP